MMNFFHPEENDEVIANTDWSGFDFGRELECENNDGLWFSHILSSLGLC